MVVHNKSDVPKALIAEFCRRHMIRRLALFGSIVHGDFGPESDVDVLVEFDPAAEVGLDFFTMEEELGRELGRKVDLHTAGSLSRRFREQVLAEAEDQYAPAR